ncbi:Stk1 family PASTA domain-containing Ser/Thr kinase [Paenibacillus sp. y28]|uniref:Stk1 family PASTA domain-containing Ser/Thr kinase n=1 Tax=Paenibacillus sp. y28 TaxID=3129110 RepID=UPI0030164741
MIGKQLGGRYEILERVGGGGMAIVYKGHDMLLHRKVAVKVLRQQYVHDEEFIRRFRREAQSAASLSHPNVVSIYDVGQEEDVHYIVMEYIEGKTLNDLIKERAPLQVDEAVHIAAQICDALDHAHMNQIVHRDIKPHNILLGINGRIKVTDFGIARAADATQITQTGSVVGSVHYFSPEHAKGVSTGAKSDIYSLGIVMYQMLTARLPFLGESPISVALKHLQENVEDPRNVNPLIPQSVENIILKSMRKNPDERYHSAGEMLRDLESCLTPQRRSEAKLAFFEDRELDEERTLVMPAIRDSGTAAVTTSATTDRHAAFRPEDERQVEGKKRSIWALVGIWLAVAVILIGGMWLAVVYALDKIRVPEVEVPSFVGQTAKVAEARLTELKLIPKQITEYNEAVAKDVVYDQKPAGSTVREGATVNIYVSLGPQPKQMPNLTGKTAKEAEQELAAIGVQPSQIKTEEVFYDEEVGKIIKQSPEAAAEMDPKTVAVKLTISKGKDTFAMPDLIGKTEEVAKSTLKVNGLELKDEDIIRQPSLKQTKGKVFDQWPFEANEPVSKGQRVKIYVSTGLPEEAGEIKVSLPISPDKSGKSSEIRILLTDARYENVEIKKQTITKQEVFEIVVVVTKDKNAVIQVLRDNQLTGDSRTVTYKDYEASQNKTSTPASDAGTGASAPAASPTPTPTAKPVSTKQNGGQQAAAGGGH